PPGAEALVKRKHHLHCRVNDVIRCTVYPACVLLGSIRNEILKLIFTFYDLWWFIDDRHVSSLLSLVSKRANTTSCTQHEGWAGATPQSFWAAESPKRGVAPAQPGFCPAPKMKAAHRASLLLLETSVHHTGERDSELRGDSWIHARVTIPPGLIE